MRRGGKAFRVTQINLIAGKGDCRVVLAKSPMRCFSDGKPETREDE